LRALTELPPRHVAYTTVRVGRCDAVPNSRVRNVAVRAVALDSTVSFTCQPKFTAELATNSATSDVTAQVRFTLEVVPDATVAVAAAADGMFDHVIVVSPQLALTWSTS